MPRDVLDKEESSSINELMSAGKFHNMAKVNRPIEKEEGGRLGVGVGEGSIYSCPLLMVIVTTSVKGRILL